MWTIATVRRGFSGGHPTRRARRFGWLLGLLFLLGGVVRSAEAAGNRPLVALEELEGRSIARIEVFHPSTVSIEELKVLLGFSEGARLELDSLRNAARRLFADGRFRQVRFGGIERPDGTVGLVLELEPTRILGRVTVASAPRLDAGWLKDALALEIGVPIDTRDLGTLERRLKSRLARKGWRASRVQLALDPLDDRGSVDLEIRVEPGPQTRVREVRVEGELPYPAWDVDLGLKKGQALDLDRLDARRSELEVRLRRDRYLDARLEEARVVPVPEEDSSPLVDVVVPVEVGLPVEIVIEGNRRLARSRLLEDAVVLEELGTVRTGLEELRERILARYERLGHYRSQVRVYARESEDGERREVLLGIEEGPGSYVLNVRFPGAASIAEDRLREQVQETVARFLSADLARAGVDPEVVARSLRSAPEGRRRRQPSTAAPNPKRVYVPRAYQAAAETIADLYRSEGYQSVRVDGPKRIEMDAERMEVEFEVQEGIRWTVGSLAFFGHDGVDNRLLFEAVGFALAPGAAVPLVFERVEEARRAIATVYENLGYVHVSVQDLLREVPERGSLGGMRHTARRGLREICADAEAKGTETCAVEVGFRIDPGPRVRVRDVIVRGLRDTELSVVEAEVRLRPGDWMARSRMVESRDNLVRLGIFDRVAVRPANPDERDAVTDLLVEVRPRRNLSLDVGGGASTEEGLRVFARFAHRNLLGRALRFQANAKINLWTDALLAIYEQSIRDQIRRFYEPSGVFSSGPLLLIEYEVAAGLSYPRIFQLPSFSFGIDLIALRDYDPAFSEDSQRLTLIGNYDGFRPDLLGRPRRLAAQLRLNLERTDLICNEAVSGRENLCSSDLTMINPGERAAGNNFYFSVNPRLSWDFRDDPLLPKRGLLLELDGEWAKGLDAQSPDYARIEGKIRTWIPISRRFTLLFSILGGRIFPLTSNQDIPLNRRFYAGGRETIRGYPEQTLIPQDARVELSGQPRNNVSTGGLIYVAAKSELQIELIAPVSLALFYDIGDLWRQLSEEQLRAEEQDEPAGCLNTRVGLSTVCDLGSSEYRRRLAQGTGFGLRLATPIGPLALDFGFPLNYRYSTVETFTIHFSVGSL